ncbi:MAG TPA: ATP-binding protein [Pyrinomonadaceae bacterium]|jgi:PAS domain S-box-containing protein
MTCEDLKTGFRPLKDESQQLAESIVETVREPLLVLDSDLQVRLANRSFYQTFHVKREETESLHLFSLGSGQWDIPELRSLLVEILPQNTQVHDYEIEREFPGLGRRIMLLNARRLDNRARTKEMILLAIEDITERKQIEQQLKIFASRLERSNRELQDFASVASHDLQEPLRKIQAFGDRLKAKCNDSLGDEGRDYLERMQSAAGRMQTLINDLLMFSRVETKAQPFVPVDLSHIAHEVASDLEIQVEQTGALLDIGELPVIDADPLQMRQLLQNLIGNSLKYRRPGEAPIIKVYATVIHNRRLHLKPGTLPDGQLCQLHVEDNGIGFDEKYLDRIFTVFQRLHGRKEFEGTGVGLAVCRKIAERHGGHITAHSSPGSGANFVVTLPVKQ